jgi:hypothetical protein
MTIAPAPGLADLYEREVLRPSAVSHKRATGELTMRLRRPNWTIRHQRSSKYGGERIARGWLNGTRS